MAGGRGRCFSNYYTIYYTIQLILTRKKGILLKYIHTQSLRKYKASILSFHNNCASDHIWIKFFKFSSNRNFFLQQERNNLLPFQTICSSLVVSWNIPFSCCFSCCQSSRERQYWHDTHQHLCLIFIHLMFIFVSLRFCFSGWWVAALIKLYPSIS